MTVPVARVVGTKMKEARKPLYFSYVGNTFKNIQSGGGRQNEYTQAGIEIVGAKGPEADAYVIATAIELVKAIGIEEFQIDIGQVDFFKGIVQEANFDEEGVEELRVAIDSKDNLSLEEILKEKNISDDVKNLIMSLPGLFGSVDVIEKIEKLNLNQCSLDALANLKAILDILTDYGYDQYVSVDLGLVPSLDYYTGMIFRGFTYGVGFPILSGGRYDNLLATYGEPTYVTGFSAGVNLLMTAIRRQKVAVDVPKTDYLICYEQEGRKAAFDKASELRNNGASVQIDVAGLEITDAIDYCGESNIHNLIFVKANGVVNYIDLKIDIRGEF